MGPFLRTSQSSPRKRGSSVVARRDGPGVVARRCRASSGVAAERRFTCSSTSRSACSACCRPCCWSASSYSCSSTCCPAIRHALPPVPMPRPRRSSSCAATSASTSRCRRQFVRFAVGVLHWDFGRSLSHQAAGVDRSRHAIHADVLAHAVEHGVVGAVRHDDRRGVGGVAQPLARPHRHDDRGVGHLVSGVRPRHGADAGVRRATSTGCRRSATTHGGTTSCRR